MVDLGVRAAVYCRRPLTNLAPTSSQFAMRRDKPPPLKPNTGLGEAMIAAIYRKAVIASILVLTALAGLGQRDSARRCPR